MDSTFTMILDRYAISGRETMTLDNGLTTWHQDWSNTDGTGGTEDRSAQTNITGGFINWRPRAISIPPAFGSKISPR